MTTATTPAAVTRTSLGAWMEEGNARFRVWAPEAQAMEVVLEKFDTRIPYALTKSGDGYFTGFIPGVGPGDLYWYRVDGRGPFPDPASRAQPLGVHGPSQIVDPRGFPWTDSGWNGLPLEKAVFYELHVGAFSPEGTFAGAVERLPQLKELGVTAVELMPVADFPGARNWGYDGVSLFAPARCYGAPDDLRRLVDRAHSLGLAVVQDVVYNHLGPDGNYLAQYSPYYFTDRHRTVWGSAVNLDGNHNRETRDFFIENALHWIGEYHMDGLRLDATHALLDESPRHFLAEFSDRVRAGGAPKPLLLIAEDSRNLAEMVKPTADGGLGMDAIWADDFHHETRRLLAGDKDGYFRDFSGTVEDLAVTVRDGWFYRGQESLHLGGPRGTDPSGIGLAQAVVCLQNHDQVGNRALGERLNHQIDSAAFRAATVLLLFLPETPLLFMGQEWGAGTPFLYFTDHNPELGRQVTEGRRQEFKDFAAFADPAARAKIPDPQSPATFEISRLRWDEREKEPHAGLWRMTQALLRLRRTESALAAPRREGFDVRPLGGGLVLRRRAPDGTAIAALVQLKGAGALAAPAGDLIFSTEDPAWTSDARPVSLADGRASFARPGAVLLREKKS